jgi:Flp pilus assembly pilin Flp
METDMKRFIARIHTRLDDVREAHDHGGVAAEYGVLLAGIVAVVAVAAAALGGRIDGIFDSILP